MDNNVTATGSVNPLTKATLVVDLVLICAIAYWLHAQWATFKVVLLLAVVAVGAAGVIECVRGPTVAATSARIVSVLKVGGAALLVAALVVFLSA